MKNASTHPLYNRWKKMIHRCHNPYHHKYPLYGARGISVCDRWRESFDDFVADLPPQPSPKHTLDRVDPYGNYEPGNVAWATAKEQARNRRNSIKHTIGETSMVVADWSEATGMPDSVVRARLSRGWGLSAALYLPPYAKLHKLHQYSPEVLSIAAHYQN